MGTRPQDKALLPNTPLVGLPARPENGAHLEHRYPDGFAAVGLDSNKGESGDRRNMRLVVRGHHSSQHDK